MKFSFVRAPRRHYNKGMKTEYPALVRAENISKSYHQGSESVFAVVDASLEIHPGELVAITGPSGSGKSTLAHVVGGLMWPDKGELRIKGKPFRRRSDKILSAYRNAMVGFVFQNFNLLPHYTVLENVMLPLIIAGVAPDKREERARLCLSRVGLLAEASRKPTQLSGGERQRVSIARALVASPKLIIADEPTGNLDTKRANEIMTLLEQLRDKQNVGILMVTHDEKLAARADRILQIIDGRIQKEIKRAKS